MKNKKKNGKKVLSKDEEEAKSAALIAKLLKQDNDLIENYTAYYDEYSSNYQPEMDLHSEISSEDEYDPNETKPKSRVVGKKKKKTTVKNPTFGTPDTNCFETIRESQILEEKSEPTFLQTTVLGPSASGYTADNVGDSVDLKIVEKSKDKLPTPTSIPCSPISSSLKEIEEVQHITEENDHVLGTTSDSCKKKRRKTIPEGMSQGIYSQEEEKLFLSGLELFGRDWKKLAEHIKTRDGNSIRSHAQKYFIKLYRDGLPLPEKVKESGGGYTLSGKELDPDSAAARPYLKKRNGNLTIPIKSIVKEIPDSSYISNEVISKTMILPDTEKGVKSQESPIKESHSTPKKCLNNKQITPKSSEKLPAKRKLNSAKQPSFENQESYDADGRTTYSKSRLRHSRNKDIIGIFDERRTDPHTMVKCGNFIGAPGSGLAGSQPFSITVSSNALLMMDMHAHLKSIEVIGFLSGKWDSVSKVIHIETAWPCRGMATNDDHTNVEMDPTSEFEVRSIIRTKNQDIVGWYHSHPTFPPDPSVVDIENQTNHQRLFKNENSPDEPFVGAIVGPYDPLLPGPRSVINWFYVSNSIEDRGLPKRLSYKVLWENNIQEDIKANIFSLLESVKNHPFLVRFNEEWKPGVNQTRMEKIILSLKSKIIPDVTASQKPVNESAKSENQISDIKESTMEEESELGLPKTSQDPPLGEINSNITTIENDAAKLFEELVSFLESWE